MKRMLSVVVAALLVFGLLTGCGSQGSQAEPAAEASSAAAEASAAAPEAADEPAADETPAPEGSAEEAAEEPAEPEYTLQEVDLPLFEETREYTMWAMLPFFMDGLITDMAQDINTLRLLQEYCNTKLIVQTVGDQVVDEQFNLMVASGDYTDIIADGLSHYTKGYDAAISDDIIIDLYDLAEEYAPNYMYYIHSDPEIRASLITDNGCLPAAAIIYKERGSENGGLIVRDDWLRELGMDIPNTYDAFHDYVQATMREYGAHGMSIGSPMSANKADDVLFSYGFDFNAGGYNVIDGEVVYSYLNENYYDYLRLLADWYADGTIYSDFFNASMGLPDRWFASGECGANTATAANIATIAAYAAPSYPYEIAPVGALKKDAGDQLHFSWTDTHSQIKQQDTWAISTACEDPEGILMMINYLFSPAGELMFNFGDEGNTFEYDENGQPQYTDLVKNNPYLSYMDACFILVSAAASGHMPGILDLRPGYYYFGEKEWAIFDSFKTCDADGTYNLPNGVALNEEENEEYARISSDVTTYASSELMKFLMGQSELNEETFAAFRETMISMGAERMEELYQQAYERYLVKIG